MAFDESNRPRIEPRVLHRPPDDLRLPCQSGCGETELSAAVVVRRAALNDRVDRVTVSQRVLEALENYDAHAATENGPIRTCGVRTDMSVAREDAVSFVQIPSVLRYAHRHATCQRNVTAS